MGADKSNENDPRAGKMRLEMQRAQSVYLINVKSKGRSAG